MLKLILNFLGGSVASKLADAYKARLDASNATEKLEADQNIKFLEAKRDILLQEQSHWATRWIRPLIAFPFVVYILKVVIWDKVLMLGTTDPLSGQFHEIMMVVLGAYFLTRPLEKIFKRK